MFDPDVDYDPYLSTEVSKWGGAVSDPLRDRIIYARTKLTDGIESVTAEDISNLYYLQKADKRNDLGEASATMSAIASISNARISAQATASGNLVAAGERAMLVEVQESIERNSFSETRSQLNEYRAYMESAEARIEFGFFDAVTLEEEGRVQDALSSVLLSLAMLEVAGQSSPGFDAMVEMYADDITSAGGTPNLNVPNSSWALGKADIQSLDGQIVPISFELLEPYPNPFNPSVTFPFNLPSESPVKIVVYDMLGRQVAIVIDRTYQPGSHSVVFNAINLSTGTYLVKFTAGPENEAAFTTTKLISLLK